MNSRASCVKTKRIQRGGGEEEKNCYLKFKNERLSAVSSKETVVLRLWGGDIKIIWFYQLCGKRKLATVKSFKADVWSFSPSLERR